MTAIHTQNSKKARRLTGVVVSDKMQKTAVVEISHVRRHARYQKYYRVSRRLKAHNEGNAFHAGDTVVIEETRPLSRDKRWRIIGKTQTAKNEIVGEPSIANGTLDPRL